MNILQCEDQLDALESEALSLQETINQALTALATDGENEIAHQAYQRATARMQALPIARDKLRSILASLQEAQITLEQEAAERAYQAAIKELEHAKELENAAAAAFVQAGRHRLQIEAEAVAAAAAAGYATNKGRSTWLLPDFKAALFEFLEASSQTFTSKLPAINITETLSKRAAGSRRSALDRAANQVFIAGWGKQPSKQPEAQPDLDGLLKAYGNALLRTELQEINSRRLTRSLAGLKAAIEPIVDAHFLPAGTISRLPRAFLNQLHDLGVGSEVINEVNEAVAWAVESMATSDY
ncbi:MAG: hypothetical protein ABI947_01020 [Chloroflexota bacterium]